MTTQDQYNNYYQPENFQYGVNQYDPNTMNFGNYQYQHGDQPQQQDYAFQDPVQPPIYDPYAQHPSYSGQMFVPDTRQTFSAGSSSGMKPDSENFDDEPPLLEELGINFNHILQKTLTVLNPLKQAELEVVQDTDLAGPLVFCLAFGAALLLTGKLHFGYIFGIGVSGCVALYALLSLMNPASVSVTCVMSTLGYCLLPMCLLSVLSVLLSLRTILGIVLTCLAVFWCSVSSSKLFVTSLNMDHQRILVAYPCALIYGVFALLTVF